MLILVLNLDYRLLLLGMCFHVLNTQDGFDILQVCGGIFRTVFFIQKMLQ